MRGVSTFATVCFAIAVALLSFLVSCDAQVAVTGRAVSRTSKPAVIINIGTQSIKAGFAGDTVHSFQVPNVVGRPKAQFQSALDQSNTKIMIGQQALDYADILDLRPTIENGIIVHFNDLQLLLTDLIISMGISPINHPFFITLGAANPNNVVSKIYKIFFQVFLAPAVYVSVQGMAEARAAVGAALPALSISTGDQVTSVVPVNGGSGGVYIFPLAMSNQLLAGRNVTNFIFTQMKAKYPDITTATVSLLKVSGLFFVRENGTKVPSGPKSVAWTAPDGKVYTVPGDLRWKATEFLIPALVKQIKDAMAAVPASLQPKMWPSVMISGGNSMFVGYTIRVANELAAINRKSKVIIVERRGETLFNGAAILAANKAATFWVTRADYVAKDQSAFDTVCLRGPAPGVCACNGPSSGCKMVCQSGKCGCVCDQKATKDIGFLPVGNSTANQARQGRLTLLKNTFGTTIGTMLSDDYPRTEEMWGGSKVYAVKSTLTEYCFDDQKKFTYDWENVNIEHLGLPPLPAGCFYVPNIVLAFGLKSVEMFQNYVYSTDPNVLTGFTPSYIEEHRKAMKSKLGIADINDPRLDFYAKAPLRQAEINEFSAGDTFSVLNAGCFGFYQGGTLNQRCSTKAACGASSTYRNFVLNSKYNMNRGLLGSSSHMQQWVFAVWPKVTVFANRWERWAGPTFYYHAAEFVEQVVNPPEEDLAEGGIEDETW